MSRAKKLIDYLENELGWSILLEIKECTNKKCNNYENKRNFLFDGPRYCGFCGEPLKIAKDASAIEDEVEKALCKTVDRYNEPK